MKAKEKEQQPKTNSMNKKSEKKMIEWLTSWQIKQTSKLQNSLCSQKLCVCVCLLDIYIIYNVDD